MELNRTESVRDKVKLFEKISGNIRPQSTFNLKPRHSINKNLSNASSYHALPLNFVDELKTFLDKDKQSKCHKEALLKHIQNLKNTEKQYVDDLKKAIQLYDIFLRSGINLSTGDKFSEMLKMYIDLFLKNESFFNDLSHCNNNNVECVLNIFISHESMFQQYTKYLVLQHTLCDTEKDYTKITKKLQQQVEMTWNISSYLLKPWQRIIQYLLTLQLIEKYMTQQNRSTEKVMKALAIVKEATTKANDYVALELLVNCPIPVEIFGQLTMRDTFIWKQKRINCMVFLFGAVIVLSKIKHTPKQFKFMEVITFNEIEMVNCIKNKLLNIKIVRNKEKIKYLMEAETEQVAQRWLKAMEMKILYKCL